MGASLHVVRGPVAQALHFDAEVFTREAYRAGQDGDRAAREALGAEAVRRWCRYWDHLAESGVGA